MEGTNSSVIGLSHYHVSNSASGIATCHSNGEILLHRIETTAKYISRRADYGAKLCVGSELDDSLTIERIAFNGTLSWNLTSDHTPTAVFATKSSLLSIPLSHISIARCRTQSVRKFLVSYADGRLLLLRTNGTLLRDMTLSSQLFDIRTGMSSLCHILIGGQQGSAVRKELCSSRPQGWDFNVRQRQNQTPELHWG